MSEDEYFISPDNIELLKEVIDLFDRETELTIIEGEVTRGYSFNFERLKMFAEKNPTFFYQKYCNERQTKVISYFFGTEIVGYRIKAFKDYQMRMKHYANMY